MKFATLISWLLTASMGGFMLRTWLARGGLRRERARVGGLPPQLIFGHAGLALSGLLVWSGYVATGTRAVAWTAVGLLMVTIAKVFLYDLSTLTSIARVVSFLVLGMLLLAGAYVYQRLRPQSPPDMRTVHPSQR